MTKLLPGICFVNAGLAGGLGSLRVVGDRIADLDVRPARGDRVVDLGGDRVLPGLINAHDHLQYTNFPRTRYRDKHENVSQWIEDVSGRRGSDAALTAGEALDFQARLFAGGLKNLLSGVTTVAHHDAWQDFFDTSAFPIRALRACGWAHSPGICGDPELQATHRSTPRAWVWIAHAGEGVDAAARAEFERLDALGCVDDRTLLVHALGFDAAQIRRLLALGAGVVWCASSNLFLFGRTLDPRPLLAAGRLALGSDSRLSGERDLLAELRAAQHACGIDPDVLELLVTRDNARLLRLPDRGALRRGLLADLVVIPARANLADVERRELRLVMVGGRMAYGDAQYAVPLESLADCIPVQIDGHDKVLERRHVELLARSAWREPGLVLPQTLWRAA